MLSSFRSGQPSQPQPNMYPQLPQAQQPNQWNAQPGAMQPYNAAGPSQPQQLYQPQQQQLYQPQQQFQQPVNQVQGYNIGGQAQGGEFFNNAQQPTVYHAAPQNQVQPAFQGQPQQGVQLQAAPAANQYQQTSRPTVLTPQQLESVSRTEDPIYGPLGRVRGKMERAMKADDEISPDLLDMLNVPTNDQYGSVPSPEFRPFRLDKQTPLPDALHHELHYKHQTAKMGLFEDIERAWFTVDNKLFLWDYANGRDFNRYDEQADTIQAVGLVKASKSVFVDDITHLLIICTLSKVTILGLARTSPREINLFDTGISLDSPTPIISISGTDIGRIFMLGQNKEMYELEYQSTSGWLFGSSSTRGSLRNKTGGSAWVPSIFSSGGKDGVESFTVDAQRQRLFLLWTNGDVQAIDVAGEAWVALSRYSGVKRDLARYNMSPQRPGDKSCDVVKLFAVAACESRSVCLVALCGNGARVYFTMGIGSAFAASVIRSPPFPNLNFSSHSFYSSGALLAVQHDESGPTPSTNLYAISPNVGRQSVLREFHTNFDAPIYQELTVTEQIPSQVWDIVELPAHNPAFSAPSERRSDGSIALNPLVRQSSSGERRFLILAVSGLFSVIMPRPVDMLSRGVESLDKETVRTSSIQHFGTIQTSAMAILLGASTDSKNSDISSAVATILGVGTPTISETTAGRVIVYSQRHDGLALVLARYLRPIWTSRVTNTTPQRQQTLGVPPQTLLEVQARLEGLRSYIDEYPFARSQAQGDQKIAWDQEELSLHGISVLIKQTIEAISFVLLLSDYKISDIVAKCDMGLQSMLSNLTWQGLLTSTDGRDIAKKLVTALIEQQIGQELGIDTLSELLQQRCGSFCQPGDVVLYKAEESIRRAESSRDPVERNDYLKESLRLFSKAAGNVAIPRLQDVAKRFRDLGFTVGSIELPLRCASELDPQDRATDFVRDGEHPSDPRRALYNARMECYSCVIEALGLFDEALDKATAAGNGESKTVLLRSAADPSAGAVVQKRDEAYALAIASDDELFHFYLYDWHVARHLSEQLLEFDTPYIEKYLQITSSGVEERRDLLWKYYARREEYLAASKALFELATRNSALPLHDRAYYLAQSLTAAKSAASVGSDDVEFASNLQERIDVAQVQMEVARAIEVHPEMSAEEKSGTLGRLDRELIGLDELYQGFARPYRLYEPILLILKTADTRIDDVCEAVWRQLLQQASGAAQRDQGTGRDARIGEVVKELMRRYFPSEAAPLDLVLPVVYGEAALIRGAPGWASEALLDGGVPLRDLWEAVMAMFEESDDQAYYTEEAGVLAERWISAKDQIPAAEVERFASAYLLRTNAGDQEERTRRTRERMGAAKAAAGRY